MDGELGVVRQGESDLSQESPFDTLLLSTFDHHIATHSKPLVTGLSSHLALPTECVGRRACSRAG